MLNIKLERTQKGKGPQGRIATYMFDYTDKAFKEAVDIALAVFAENIPVYTGETAMLAAGGIQEGGLRSQAESEISSRIQASIGWYGESAGTGTTIEPKLEIGSFWAPSWNFEIEYAEGKVRPVMSMGEEGDLVEHPSNLTPRPKWNAWEKAVTAAEKHLKMKMEEFYQSAKFKNFTIL